MAITEKEWRLIPFDESHKTRLTSELKIHPLLCQILAQRGVSNYDSAKSFFRPLLSDLHDPMLMRDMDKAVKRILKALTHQERILVYGDYDVDGTMAVCVVFDFLFQHLPRCSYSIPEQWEGVAWGMRGVYR